MNIHSFLKRFRYIVIFLCLIVQTFSQSIDLDAIIKKYGYCYANEAQRALVKEAQKCCGITEKVHVVSYPDSSQAQTITFGKEHVLAVCRTEITPLTRAIVYHELGHVSYNDSPLTSKLNAGLIFAKDLVHDANLIKAASRIKQYVHNALLVLDTSSPLGSQILSFVAKKGKKTILNKQIDSIKSAVPTFKIEEIVEQRADIFAVSKLLAEGRWDSILALMSDLFGDDQDLLLIRRVLNIAGYLIAQKQDINIILRRFATTQAIL